MLRADRSGRRALMFGAAAALATPAFAQIRAGSHDSLNGIGATVPHRLYRAWADRFGPVLGLSLRYVPLGSGSGRRAAIDRLADFGGSDSAMSASQLRAANLVQIPTTSAALGFVVNLPGVDIGRLRLGRDDLLGIFTGDIRRWSDPRLRLRNPDLDLPHLAITPILRREASGSTNLAAAWLSGATAAQETGNGPLDRTPGLAVHGADGVAQSLLRLRGSIGYLEATGARQFGLTVLDCETDAGTFVSLTQAMSVPSDDRAGMDWPLVTRSHILIPDDPAHRQNSARVARFFRHCLLNGAEVAAAVGYLPLPQPDRATAINALTAICECT